MSNQGRVFWFHYNKPEARKQGKPVLTVHYMKRCILVHHIICDVSTWTHHRKSQPRCVIKGKGIVEIKKDGEEITAYITES